VHVGVKVRGEEQDVYIVEEFIGEARGRGFEESGVVAFLIKEPHQDTVDKCVGAQDELRLSLAADGSLSVLNPQ
jgi:hypothetical protein